MVLRYLNKAISRICDKLIAAGDSETKRTEYADILIDLSVASTEYVHEMQKRERDFMARHDLKERHKMWDNSRVCSDFGDTGSCPRFDKHKGFSTGDDCMNMGKNRLFQLWREANPWVWVYEFERIGGQNEQ